MSDGMLAMMRAAESGPLNFHISMYCGQMVVQGRVAPSSWWYDVTKAARRAEVWQTLGKARDNTERARLADINGQPFVNEVDRAQASDELNPNEVTLVDVSIFPAVSSQGTRSGGQRLPVARVPLSSIDLWWIVSGDTIKGQSGTNFAWGFLFPV